MRTAQKLLHSIVDEMNEHELDELSVHALSDWIGLSRWQLQRTFLTLTDVTLNDHIRNFKLSKGAQRLVNSQTGILDIAIETGFGSQAAFSRAFKAKFGLTPGQYRKRGLFDEVSFQLFIPTHRKWSKAMNITIETKPSMELKGLSRYFNGHGMPEANNFEVLPALWAQFNEETSPQTHEIKRWFGFIGESDNQKEGQLKYLASFNSADGTLSLSQPETEHVPEQQYAIVPHHGLLQNIGETLDAFYGEWLPESDYKMSGNVNIEVYDHRFDATSADSYFETWVPVVKK